MPLREIASIYLRGDSKNAPLKSLIKEGDEVIVQVVKEERGNKGAALTTNVSIAGRYLVLVPHKSDAGGISRQASGKVRDDLRAILDNLPIPEGMSVIVRTAGIDKSHEELTQDLTHLLETWANACAISKSTPSLA